MGFITKFLGPTKLQEQFDQAIGLNWILVLRNINRVEHSFGNGTSVVQGFPHSNLAFDFFARIFVITGVIGNDVFRNNVNFEIFGDEKINGGLVVYLLSTNSPDVQITCTIKRNYIIFENFPKNWFAKFDTDNFQIDLSNN